MAEEKVEKTEIDERRYFMGPDEETRYYIAIPSAENIKGADWQYSKTYTQCLVEGITTSAEMMDILMRRGIIGPEFEKRAQELASNLNEKILLLEAASDVDEKRILSVDVAQAREELFQWNQRLNGPMNNTCESISDDSRLEFLTSCMVQNKDGKRVWDSYDLFLTDRTNALPIKARFEVMLYLQGLDSDFLDQTPEARAMKEVEIEVLAKAEEALRAARAVEEEQAAEATAKKTTKKKTTKKTTKKK